MEKEQFSVDGATVPFYRYTINDTLYIEFDTSKCGPPEPMVNAMTALELIKDSSTKVVMINHKMPMGLFDKIGKNFEIADEKLPDGTVKLVFSYKAGATEGADLSQKSCGGH